MESDFGKYLEELRGKMSLRKAAKKAGISHTYLRDLELGKKTDPSRDTLLKLAACFDVSYYDLLFKANYDISEDDTKLINIYKEEDQLKKEIISKLQLLTDDEGYFYEHLREEIFKAISSNIYMGYAFHDSSEWKYFEEYFINYFSSDPDEYPESEHEEAEEMFNKAYEIRTIINVIKSNSANYEELSNFHSALDQIILKYNLNEKVDLNSKDEKIDLSNILEGHDLVYNGHPVTETDKQLIKSYLDALFSNR